MPHSPGHSRPDGPVSIQEIFLPPYAALRRRRGTPKRIEAAADATNVSGHEAPPPIPERRIIERNPWWRGAQPEPDTMRVAQQDATGIPQPGVVPQQKGPARAISGIMHALGAVLGHETPGLPEGTASGPGPMEWLSPEGAAAGVAKASLPLFGRAARGPVTDVADDVRFLDRIIGDVPAEDFWKIFDRAGSTPAIEQGAERADMMTKLADIFADESGFEAMLDRSRALGAAEATQTQRGRALLAADQARHGGRQFSLDPTAQMKRLDDAALRTLLEDIIGFSGEVTR